MFNLFSSCLVRYPNSSFCFRTFSYWGDNGGLLMQALLVRYIWRRGPQVRVTVAAPKRSMLYNIAHHHNLVAIFSLSSI
ncbi:hypothetical protein BaRGS_00002671 [Batillaria attramentaria]|uniref:Uncharacterized protein n=1 Tax=Batillaria attramentaria TaxID=370345 RepID=A0ABD0M2B5_9CAEN